MSSLVYVIDEVFLGHHAPQNHPERPERLRAVWDALKEAGLEQAGRALRTRMAEDAEIGAVHTASYLSELEQTVPGKSGWLDGDTYYSKGSWDAARAAVGAVIDVTRAVLSGECERGLALVRPPGHHAVPDRAMGFCMFNNVAAAAADARARGASRVAILDWDVHHGNGTEHMFYEDPSVLYLSCHQFPFYPGTGRPQDVGAGPGLGANVNVGLPAGCGDAEYAQVFERVFEPALVRFAPDLLIVSAGFDAHVADPLAGMRVTRAGYRAMAESVRDVADRVCQGRLVCALEGGYDLGGLAGGVTALFEALDPRQERQGRQGRMSRERDGDDPGDAQILGSARYAIEATLACLEALPPETPLAGEWAHGDAHGYGHAEETP